MPTSPKIFISYSHDSPEHKARVLALAKRLRDTGVDVQLDQWVQEPDGGWPFWMETQIKKSDCVLLVCTESSRKLIDDPFDHEYGYGVFWEANILRKRIYDAKHRAHHTIPAFFGSDGAQYIPTMLQTATYYRLDDPASYESLYRRLTDQPMIIKPELGEVLILAPATTERSSEAESMEEKPASREIISSELALLTPVPCGDERAKRSIGGLIKSEIQFENHLPFDVDIFWRSYEGLPVFCARVVSGGGYGVLTYLTHPFLIAKAKDGDAPGECLMVFLPENFPARAVIR